MKKIIISLFVLIFSSLSFAQDRVCGEWKTYDNGKSFSCLYWTTPYKAPTPIYQEACKTVTDSYGNPQITAKNFINTEFVPLGIYANTKAINILPSVSVTVPPKNLGNALPVKPTLHGLIATPLLPKNKQRPI